MKGLEQPRVPPHSYSRSLLLEESLQQAAKRNRGDSRGQTKKNSETRGEEAAAPTSRAAATSPAAAEAISPATAEAISTAATKAISPAAAEATRPTAAAEGISPAAAAAEVV